MSDLVGNPEDRFSRIEAHSMLGESLILLTVFLYSKHLLQFNVNFLIILQPTGFYVKALRLIDPLHKKTNNMHRQEQRRRSAVQRLCFR